jgi:hypothetical protein
MAAWYEQHLHCSIQFSSGIAGNGGCFIADSSGETILELYKIPSVEPLATVQSTPLQVHIAFKSADPFADSIRLVDAGATFIEGINSKSDEDVIVLLRDPWGTYIQLVQRARNKNLK